MSKSRVPAPVRAILDADKVFTQIFVSNLNKLLPLRSYRKYYKGLEISCHGIVWLAFWIAFAWVFNATSYVQLQMNMLFGLVLDIILVAIVKAFARRRRPTANKDDAVAQMGPDCFSFPSGHASRAVFVSFFFTYLYPLNFILNSVIFAWCCALCLSRVLMHRHYVLDVVAGIILGLFEGAVVGILWLDGSTAEFLMSFLSDEKVDGGDFHV